MHGGYSALFNFATLQCPGVNPSLPIGGWGRDWLGWEVVHMGLHEILLHPIMSRIYEVRTFSKVVTFRNRQICAYIK